MKLLLDTLILLWAAAGTLPPKALSYITDEANELYFSSASIWEIIMKERFSRDDFFVNPHSLHHGLITNGYQELRIAAKHALAVHSLPEIHNDPFDRILIAQAVTEGLHLITADAKVSAYAAPIIFVQK